MEFEIRGRNLSLPEPLEFLVQRRLDAALGRFSEEIRKVDVKLADLHGPRGGCNKRCRVEVILAHGGSVRAESTEEHLRDAIDLAVHRAGRRIGRRLDRGTTHRRGLRFAG